MRFITNNKIDKNIIQLQKKTVYYKTLTKFNSL